MLKYSKPFQKVVVYLAKMRLAAIILIMLLLLLSGACSIRSDVKSHLSKRDTTVHLPKNLTDSKEDGHLISLKKVRLADADPSIENFLLMYWSEGEKVAAYLAIPKKRGTYPLYVYCHDGYLTPVNLTHYTGNGENLDDPKDDPYNENVLYNAFDSAITLIPMYRGYDKSDGKVSGLNKNTIDTNNAIKAAEYYFSIKTETHHIDKVGIYLSGDDVGGGVALNVSAHRDDVLSVVVFAPFVGWDILGDWLNKHRTDATWFDIYFSGKNAYGDYSPDNPAYKNDSIDYQNITAPVLLVESKDDDFLPWETMQTFYEKIKTTNPNAKFKLFESGIDQTVIDNEINQLLNDWYNSH